VDQHHNFSSPLRRARTLRVYEGVWQQLRLTQEIVLEVIDVGFVPRIKKAISKEKYMDVGFNLINEIESYKLYFYWSEEKKELRIELRSKFGLTETLG
jgi:hypothetical protein